jgi:N-acetylmuramic acid 6-phosphate (MurNAc-6-P) etherase
MNENLPITEQSNEITKNIDKATSIEIINLFSQTDKQLFNYNSDIDTSSNSLYDSKILDKIEKLAEIAHNNHNKSFKIILSGCGTSGRLAYIAAKNLNEYLNQNICEYIIAGGDYALINSVEAVEDSPESGVDALKQLIANIDSFIFIGITCGLSAPFVAGQLDFCFQLNDKIALAVGLIGFNPVELARKNEFKLPKSDKTSTFHQIIDENKHRSNFYLLNPLVGPEPITGSSRMKSGSATKVILDLIFLKFLFKNTDLSSLVSVYENLLDKCLYKAPETCQYIASLIDRSTEALNNSCSVNYLSLDIQIGILGCVDASE